MKRDLVNISFIIKDPVFGFGWAFLIRLHTSIKLFSTKGFCDYRLGEIDFLIPYEQIVGVKLDVAHQMDCV